MSFVRRWWWCFLDSWYAINVSRICILVVSDVISFLLFLIIKNTSKIWKPNAQWFLMHMNLISTSNNHLYSNFAAKHMEIIFLYLSHLATCSFLIAEFLKIFIIEIHIKFIMKHPPCYSKNSVRISFEKTHSAPQNTQPSFPSCKISWVLRSSWQVRECFHCFNR